MQNHLLSALSIFLIKFLLAILCYIISNLSSFFMNEMVLYKQNINQCILTWSDLILLLGIMLVCFVLTIKRQLILIQIPCARLPG